MSKTDMMKRHYSGILTVVILPIISLGLLFLSPGIKDVSLTRVLGKVAGVLGMTGFAISLILSARYKFLDIVFNGLNKVYERHGQIGQISLMLLLSHPLFLSGGDFRFLLPSGNHEIDFGIYALLLLLILIVLTLYLMPKYNIWKWTHKFMGAAFFLGSLHAFLIPSDTSVYMPLRWYLLSLSTLGIFSFLYRSVFHKLVVKKYEYTVEEVKKMGGSITEIKLRPLNEKMDFLPGQFVFASFGGEETHPFSVSAGADAARLTLSVKDLGDYTRKLENLERGTKAEIEGPFGRFTYKDSVMKKQIWIAGGIGITPFLSMARSIKDKEGYQVDLYYCVRNEKESVYLSELENMGKKCLHLIPHYSDQEGYINAEKIAEKSGPISEKAIFICSPVPMIESLTRQFLDRGIKKWFIHSEEFSL